MYTSFGYRFRKRIRLRGFTYGGGASYHVTINAFHKRELFGTCEGSTVTLSDIGEIVQSHWLATERIRPQVLLDEFCILPDHMHGIIHLLFDPHERITEPLQRKLFRIIGGFKSGVTSAVRFRLHDAEFEVWQPRFNDRIIRNTAELDRWRAYVRSNPGLWSARDIE